MKTSGGSSLPGTTQGQRKIWGFRERNKRDKEEMRFGKYNEDTQRTWWKFPGGRDF